MNRAEDAVRRIARFAPYNRRPGRPEWGLDSTKWLIRKNREHNAWQVIPPLYTVLGVMANLWPTYSGRFRTHQAAVEFMLQADPRSHGSRP